MASVIGGVLADRFGSKVVLGASFAIWSAFSAFTGFAQNVTHLILVRLGDRPLPPAIRIDDRLAVRFEPIGSGGIYLLVHGEVLVR